MSKFLSFAQIRESIQRIGKFHPFFGTTFLVLKRNEAPIGQTMRLSLDAENRELLRRHYRPHPKSDHFFLPFKKRKTENHWRKPKYASATLQAANTQTFTPALLHQKDGKDWGWDPGYLQFLATKLPKGQKLPLLQLAVWFGREEAWEESITRADIVEKFVIDYHLTAVEISTLFDFSLSSAFSEDEAFQSTPVKWDRIIEGLGTPEDVPPEGSAILHFLEFSGLGPPRRLVMPPAARLNVVTGDNGLGKTFILDIVWWALTQEWAEHMLVPLGAVATPPQIKFTVSSAHEQKPVTAEFNLAGYNWDVPAPEAVSGLVIYARVDGSFAVWDPANPNLSSRGSSAQPRFVSFTREEIWNGDRGNKIDGLLRDWVRWQTRPDEFPAFATFEKVVQRTKPPDLGEFSIGKPERIQGWPIEIPTLVHPYGTVPIVYESAGIRRILTLAYLIVWAWEEHKIQAKAAGRKEERQMVILLDEAEAHLHPRWQRVLLPALLGIANDLHEELAIQYFIATHSPLVLASAEPVWDASVDKLFHLRMNANGKVIFDFVPFELRGTADSWLQSPSFDGLHPGSEPAEDALRQAKALLKTPDVTTEQVRAASDKLAQHIAAEDPFWLRWLLFAAQHGVEL